MNTPKDGILKAVFENSVHTSHGTHNIFIITAAV